MIQVEQEYVGNKSNPIMRDNIFEIKRWVYSYN